VTMERIVAKDETGAFVEADVIVRRKTILAVSCSCWNHRAPFRIEAIETLASLYFRPAGSAELYREIGHHGPIVIEVESVTRIRD
jgi:hypothetical protein